MRRGLGATLLAAAGGAGLLLLAALAPPASANVIGIDMGVDFMKVGANPQRTSALKNALACGRLAWGAVQRRGGGGAEHR